MTKEEEDLIIAEQNKSTKEILKAIEQEKCELLGIIQGKDKVIKDLERKLEQTEKDLTDYQFNYPKIKDLEKQIEKMKCCGNCKHRYFIGDELECHLLDNGINCDNEDKWEIKENDRL